MDPRLEYAKRLEALRADAAQRQKASRQVGNARLGTAIAGVVLSYFVFGQTVIAAWWLVLPVALFVALVAWHTRIELALEQDQRGVAFYEAGLSRIEGRWMGQGDSGERYRNTDHVYTADLDIFGEASLYELLCTARTKPGKDLLAAWLSTSADGGAVRARQEAVADLRSRMAFRESFATVGRAAEAGMDAEALKRWGTSQPVVFPAWARGVAAAVSGLVVVMFFLYMAQVTTRTPFLAVLFVEFGFALAWKQKADAVAAGIDANEQDLELLAELLRRWEGETFEAPLLLELRRRFQEGDTPASQRVADLGKLVERLEWEHNLFFRPLGLALLWRPQHAMAVEAWRKHSGPQIGVWIQALAEFEAVLALSAYSFEHPGDPFPELGEGPGAIEAQGVGHPLLPAESSVRNDVRLGGDLRLLVVSGSNMSGKSTLLRSVGLNVVLALAGAPVRATRLALTPLALGASIRVTDSLQDGKSRFYAEITRIRQIVGLTGEGPTVLFLIDEMLSGTNSHDRRIGAEAIVRSLVERGAVGMITTHDLALAHIADALRERARNVHFADNLVNGELEFDYLLQPGVVERTNALELMRSVGLEV